MLKIYTSAQMRAADSYTINSLKIPSEELMRRAGLAIADEVAAVAEASDKILVVCGTATCARKSFYAAVIM